MTKPCFVLLPRSNSSTDKPDRTLKNYRDYFKPACEQAGFKPADSTGLSDREIRNQLRCSPLVIAYLGDGRRKWTADFHAHVNFRRIAGNPILVIRDASPRPVSPQFDPAGAGDVFQFDRRLPLESLESRLHESYKAWRRYHAVAVIEVRAGKATYIESNEVADDLLGWNGPLVGSDAISLTDESLLFMPSKQRELFKEDQKAIYGELFHPLWDGKPIVSSYPLVFSSLGDRLHPREKYRDRSYMPIIMHKQKVDSTTDWIRMLYLDVTSSVHLGSDGIFRYASCQNQICSKVATALHGIDSTSSRRARKRPQPVVFSFNVENEEMVREVYEQFLLRGLDPWFAPEAVTAGDNHIAEFNSAADRASIAVVFFSSGLGPWQEAELDKLISLNRDKAKNLRIIPVRLPDVTVEDLKKMAGHLSGIHAISYGAEASKEDDLWKLIGAVFDRLSSRPLKGTP